MAEVFTINGAATVGPAACGSGWEQTPGGNCGAPANVCSPDLLYAPGACRSLVALQLQQAAYALLKGIGDPAYKNVPLDGFVGPKVVAAINRIFTTHIGPGQAAATYRTGTLTANFVSTNAVAIIGLIQTEFRRRALTVAVPPMETGSSQEPKAGGKRVWLLLALGVAVAGGGVALALWPSKNS